MKTLLPHQTIGFMNIKNLIKDGENIFFIQGNSGCGKTITIKAICQNLKKKDYLLVDLKGDSILKDNEYLPFLNALGDVLPGSVDYGFSKMAVDFGGEIPKVGKPLTSIFKIFSKRTESQNQIRDLALNDKEHEILCKLQYLAEHKKTVFVCENLNYWDEKSIKLLYFILTNIQNKYTFFSNCIFLMIFTNNKKTDFSNLISGIKSLDGINKIIFPVLEFKDFNKSLKILGYQNKLSKKELTILFSLVNGHIRMLVDLISELNRSRLTLTTVEGKSKEVLASILKTRLEDYGATGSQIKITLEYASLLGLTFSSYELNRVVQMGNSNFNKVIESSSKLNLIEKFSNSTDVLQFAHDIIHDIFQQELNENGEVYYKNIELCLRQIEPNQYTRRSQYALKSGAIEKAFILFTLNLVKQLREDGVIATSDFEKCKILFSEESGYASYYEYIITMQKAYSLYRSGDFRESLNETLSLGHIYPKELLAEKEILCSFCYTKKIDPQYRFEGLNRLKKYSTLKNCNYELDIYERVLMRLLILYVHVGETESAIDTEQQILSSLGQRFNHDESAQSRFHLLNRISNSLYSCEIAANKMKKAVEYFGANSKTGGLWRDLKQFYLANVNYAGILCLNGRFAESYKKNEEIIELFQQFPEYPFPRINIFLNNYLISGYLSHQLSKKECLNMFEKFITMLPLCAERLFYISNYSIFLTLSGNISQAIDCLEKEAKLQNTQIDKENLYNYRVNLNLGVYYFLLGDIEKALSLIYVLVEHNDFNTLKGDAVYDFQRAKKIYEYISNLNDCVTPEKWENILLLEENDFQSTAWNYYGKGYVFTTTFNWDV